MTPTPALAALNRAHARRRPGPVRRAWPGPEGTLSAELAVGRQLRAATISEAGQLEMHPYGQDRKLPELEADLTQPGSRLLVHRPGKRAVVLHPEKVTQHLKATKVEPVAQATEAVGALAAQAGFEAARVLETGKAHLSYSLLPGSSLFDLADLGYKGWARLIELWPAWIEAGAQAHATGQPLSCTRGSYQPPLHDGPAEAQVLEHWVSLTGSYGSLPADADGHPLAPALTLAALQVIQGLNQPAESADRPVLLHRDLHDKQLLWDETNLALIDLDTAAYGEAALDLGNLLAHLELRTAQGLYSQDFSQQVIQRLEDLAADLEISAHRLALYRQAARIRITCIYSFRPSATPWLSGWAAHTLTHTHSI